MKPLLSHILLHGIDEHTPVEQLEFALNEHPYSATLAVLLTKAYTERNDVRFEEMLSRSALLTRQRKNLHSFVYKMMQPTADVAQGLTESSPQEETGYAMGVAPDVTEAAGAAKEDSTESIEEAPPVQEETEPAKRESKTLEKEFKEEQRTGITRDPDELLAQQYMAEALSSGALSELYDREPIASKTDVEGVEQDEVSEKEESSEKEPSKLGFSAWMSFLNEEPESKIETTESFDANPTKTDRPAIEKPKKNSGEATDLGTIIDRFMEKEDEIVPKRASFFSPEKAAKASLQDNTQIVTETLARIYADQGNTNKAIDTYEKLRLRHPEKSSYFAALIKKLKSD